MSASSRPRSQAADPPSTRREIVNALLYVCRTGCQWRALPHDLPPWATVYWYFRVWKRDGTFDRLMDLLRGDLRQTEGRRRQPLAAIIDSQSVKTTEGGARGYDAGKQVRGRKRHILMDVLGLILSIVVHAADIQDRDGARIVLGPRYAAGSCGRGGSPPTASTTGGSPNGCGCCAPATGSG